MSWRSAVVSVMVLMVLFSAELLGRGPSARADIYVYRDDNGVTCMTDRRDAVPPRFRGAMRVVREGGRQGRETGASSRAPSRPLSNLAEDAPSAAAEGAGVRDASPTGRLIERFPWVRPAALLVGIVLSLIAVRRLAALIPSPQLARLVMLLFFVGTGLFLYKSYGDYLVGGCISIKTRFLGMMKKGSVREAPDAGERPRTAGESGSP